eukprot:COSAG02_NODE_74_length_41878_cov_9.737954_32_plen_145_part_00
MQYYAIRPFATWHLKPTKSRNPPIQGGNSPRVRKKSSTCTSSWLAGTESSLANSDSGPVTIDKPKRCRYYDAVTEFSNTTVCLNRGLLYSFPCQDAHNAPRAYYGRLGRVIFNGKTGYTSIDTGHKASMGHARCHNATERGARV